MNEIIPDAFVPLISERWQRRLNSVLMAVCCVVLVVVAVAI